MALVVYSPFNGKPVKVREQDVGRAVRDADGRVFYVVAQRDGQGFYASTTRAGGPKDEERARQLELEARKQADLAPPGADVTPVFDATGTGRPGARSRQLLIILIILILVLFLVWLLTLGPLSLFPTPAPTTPAGPTTSLDGLPPPLPPPPPPERGESSAALAGGVTFICVPPRSSAVALSL